MPEVVDDKSQHCIPFILEHIKQHRERYEQKRQTVPPFFLGLNGVQGAGKTTLVNTLHETLTTTHNLPTLVFSIDDLYLPHSRQKTLAQTHPSNPLVQHRGQPSTHDIDLGKTLFHSLANRDRDIRIPAYDKSAFNGAGDQVDPSEWSLVNATNEPTIQVVIFEGWCAGFRALSDEAVERKWLAAKREFESDSDGYKGRLGRQRLESVLFVNEALRGYDALTNYFGAFVHIDAEDPLYVYTFRLEAERKMREQKGSGMKDEEVVNFINGYYPAYELYTDVLRQGIFGEAGKQLRLVVDEKRAVKEASSQIARCFLTL